MRSTRLTLAVSLWMLVMNGACTHGGSPRTASVAHSIEVSQPQCNLEREEHIALGGLKLSAVKALVKLASEEEAAEILAGVKRVEVATYDVSGGEQCRDLASLGAIEAELIQQGWSPSIREQGAGEATWVFMREGENGSTEGLYVVTFDQRELEIVRIEGRIDEILAEAIAETPSEAAQIISNEL
jgi:hypothetical protein